jgi:hypothetical protein
MHSFVVYYSIGENIRLNMQNHSAYTVWTKNQCQLNVHQKNISKRTALFNNKFTLDLQNNLDQMLPLTNI